MKKLMRNKAFNKALTLTVATMLLIVGIVYIQIGAYFTAMWVFNTLCFLAVAMLKDEIIQLQNDLIEDVLKLSDEQNTFIEKHMVAKTPRTPSPEPK